MPAGGQPRPSTASERSVPRRSVHGYSSLVSLLDVLFILVFASSIQAAAALSTTSEAVPAKADAGIDAGADIDAGPVIDAGQISGPEMAADAGLVGDAGDGGLTTASLSPSRGQVFQQAVTNLTLGLKQRGVVYAKVSATGVVTTVDRARAGEAVHLGLGAPLLERVPDPDVALAYLGDRAPELRVCAIVKERLGTDDLAGTLVVILPEVALAELPVALVRGLERDQQRCLDDQGGIAVLVDPAAAVQLPLGDPAMDATQDLP